MPTNWLVKHISHDVHSKEESWQKMNSPHAFGENWFKTGTHFFCGAHTAQHSSHTAFLWKVIRRQTRMLEKMDPHTKRSVRQTDCLAELYLACNESDKISHLKCVYLNASVPKIFARLNVRNACCEIDGAKKNFFLHEKWSKKKKIIK